MILKTYNIVNLVINDTSEYDYSITITNESGETYVLYDSKLFLTKLMHKYNSFMLLSPKYYDDEKHKFIYLVENRDDAIEYLHDLYDMWKTDRLNAIEKMYNVLRMEYVPIWNVDGATGTIHESTKTGTDTFAHSGNDTTEHTGDDTIAKSGDDTLAHSGDDTTAHSGDDTVNDNKATFDSGNTYLPYEEAKTTYDSESKTTYDSETKSTYDSENKTTYNSTNTETRNLHDTDLDMVIRQGNIGVTSTQSLETEEIKLRSKLDSIIDFAINDFVHRYLVLC